MRPMGQNGGKKGIHLDNFDIEVLEEVARQRNELLRAVQKRLDARGYHFATIGKLKAVISSCPNLLIKSLCYSPSNSQLYSPPGTGRKHPYENSYPQESKDQDVLQHLCKTDFSGDCTRKKQIVMDCNRERVIKEDSAYFFNSAFSEDSYSQDSKDRDLLHHQPLRKADCDGDLNPVKQTFINYNGEPLAEDKSTFSDKPTLFSDHPHENSEKQNFLIYHGGPSDEINTAFFADPQLVKPAEKYTEQPSFPPRSIINVSILEFKEPNDISFRRNDLYFTCSLIENDIVKWYKDIAVIMKTFRCSSETLKTGTPVIFLLHGVCKRAIVTEISQDGDSCDISLVDYGLDYKQVKISQLTLMSVTHAAYPPLFARLSLNVVDDNMVWGRMTSLETWRESNLETSYEVDLKMRGYVCGDLLTRDVKQLSLKEELKNAMSLMKSSSEQIIPQEVSAPRSTATSAYEKENEHTEMVHSIPVDSKKLSLTVKSRRFPRMKPSSRN